MARGLHGLQEVDLTVVVNVGDDDTIHGLHVSPDVDTVVYTLAGVEGPLGWGRAGDTFRMNDELARFGVDNRFQLGDTDLALKLYRTGRLDAGVPLSKVCAEVCSAFGVGARVLPATDDRLRTRVLTEGGWRTFQEYFVLGGNREEVLDLDYQGSDESSPAPGVMEALRSADLVVIAPSNPPLSVWPILAIPGIREAIADHPRVIAVSPLFGGKALKGPADRVMRSLGLPSGTEGILHAYQGLLDALIVDIADSADTSLTEEVRIVARDTRISEVDRATSLAREILEL